MPRPGSRKCLHCNAFFTPEPRAKGRQWFCSETLCRKASKRASQKRWLQKPENQEYFRGPGNVQRVQQWRSKKPGYSRKSRSASNTAVPLQDSLVPQAIESKEEISNPEQDPLQDLLIAQPAVLIGLIAHLMGTALQDDILEAGHRLRQLGEDFLHNTQPSPGDQYVKVSLTQP